jgi:hypothetical protein
MISDLHKNKHGRKDFLPGSKPQKIRIYINLTEKINKKIKEIN